MGKVSQSLRADEMSGSLYSPLGCVTAWLCICRTGGYVSVKASLPTNPVVLGTPNSFWAPLMVSRFQHLRQ